MLMIQKSGTKEHIWGDLMDLDLDAVKKLFKTKSYALRAQHLKLRWGFVATNHVKMIQQRVAPEENRCPLCGVSPDTNKHMMIRECEFPACEQVRDMWEKKAVELLKAHAASPEIAGAIAAAWVGRGKENDCPVLSMFDQYMQKEESGSASLNLPVSLSMSGAMRELGLKKIKALKNKMWQLVRTASTEMWIVRRERSPAGNELAMSESVNKRIKAVFSSGKVDHLPITQAEVLKTYKAKKKKAFLAKHEGKKEPEAIKLPEVKVGAKVSTTQWEWDML
jgi:hypothetical protein